MPSQHFSSLLLKYYTTVVELLLCLDKEKMFLQTLFRKEPAYLRTDLK